MVQTYLCLLNACAAAGRLDQVYVTTFMLLMFTLLFMLCTFYPDN